MASRPSSDERPISDDAAVSDVSRPSDHIEAPAAARPVNQPKLGPVGWLRFAWRQLTSMRTAIVLLLLLAVAAIPGSLVPQVTSDPNGVLQYRAENPEMAAVLDFFQVFNTFGSVWFSAIYLLLFVSLIGCVLPRTKHHLAALRAKPPRTPARLERLDAVTTHEVRAEPAEALDAARALLSALGYRTELYTSPRAEAADSVSAERGYLRETGNLVFHIALIGVLVAIALAGLFGYQGQKVVAEDRAFANVLGNYDSFNPGRFFSEQQLAPFSLQLDSFEVVYETNNPNAIGHALDYTATVTITERGQQPRTEQVKVNEPLAVADTNVYLMGNGFAPVITVRDADGVVVASQPVLFRPLDDHLTSLGIVKIPDGLPQQVGMRGFLYPTPGQLETGAFTSVYPELLNPIVTLEVYVGDLGLDDGTGGNAFVLNTDELTQVAGREVPGSPTLQLSPGDRIDLPDGLGSVELTSIPRFAAFDIHHDPSEGMVLAFAVLAVLGLLASLFVPRRRMWVKVLPGAAGGTIIVQYAGLARGEDHGLAAAVEDLAKRHQSRLG